MRRIAIIISALLAVYTTNVVADDSIRLEKCDKALTACEELVYLQGSQIRVLKEAVRSLESELADSQVEPLIPTWLVFVSGLVIGGTVGAAIK